MPGEEAGSKCTKSEAMTKNDIDGGVVGERRTIVQSRKMVQTGGTGGVKINCKH